MPESQVSPAHWQNPLEGPTLKLRPMIEADFAALHAVASDPMLWEQHPEKDRYKKEKFEIFFRSGIDSKGAYAIHDSATGELIGSSRYSDFNAPTSSIEIGYTFLARRCWGRGTNHELKQLMLAHAFKVVDTVYFVVGRWNTRSRLALAKIGALEVADAETTPVVRDWQKSALYRIEKRGWRA